VSLGSSCCPFELHQRASLLPDTFQFAFSVAMVADVVICELAQPPLFHFAIASLELWIGLMRGHAPKFFSAAIAVRNVFHCICHDAPTTLSSPVTKVIPPAENVCSLPDVPAGKIAGITYRNRLTAAVVAVAAFGKLHGLGQDTSP
jgi:hypothetical protein